VQRRSFGDAAVVEACGRVIKARATTVALNIDALACLRDSDYALKHGFEVVHRDDERMQTHVERAVGRHD
jgi:hypothetical protein